MPEFTTDHADDAALLAALAAVQARGVIGELSLPAAVAHADQFVAALPPAILRAADLGSGGGLPGLVIAVRRPEISLTLVERRRSRADLLERAVGALRLHNVRVFAGDVRVLAGEEAHSFDAVTARSFASPAVTARWAGELLVVDGVLVVSEPPPPAANRWPADVLANSGLVDLGRLGGVRRFRKAETAQ